MELSDALMSVVHYCKLTLPPDFYFIFSHSLINVVNDCVLYFSVVEIVKYVRVSYVNV